VRLADVTLTFHDLKEKCMRNSTPCALCGTTTAHRVMGRVGCACDGCIGEAAKQAIAKEKMPKQPNVTGLLAMR
jgi:hypothetical protein